MKRYYRIMLGQKSAYAKQAVDQGVIGADFGVNMNLSPLLGDRGEFSKVIISSAHFRLL